MYKKSLRLPGGKALQVFQLIAILHKVKFSKYVIAIEFKHLKNEKKIKTIKNYIKKYLPNVKII